MATVGGQVLIDGEDIYGLKTAKEKGKALAQRRWPYPCPVPIYDNLAYNPRIHGLKDKTTLDRLMRISSGYLVLRRDKEPFFLSCCCHLDRQQQRLSCPKPPRRRR